MQKHLAQAEHNQKFYQCICEDYGTEFFDWKITTLFYTAVHWIGALASKRSKDIGTTHEQIHANINPMRNGAMPITKTAWHNYRNLYNYCHTARYEGFVDYNTWQKIKEADHRHSVKSFNDLSKYLKDQGIQIKNSLLEN